jgi:hypothetical protein
MWDPTVSAWFEMKPLYRDGKWGVVPFQRCSDGDQVRYGRQLAKLEKERDKTQAYQTHDDSPWADDSPYRHIYEEFKSYKWDPTNQYAQYVQYGARGYGKTFWARAQASASRKIAEEFEEAMHRVEKIMTMSAEELEKLGRRVRDIDIGPPKLKEENDEV